MRKRIVALIGAVLMIATMMSGCTKMDPAQTIATVDGVEIKLDLANFYARYQQMQIESMYGSLMGGSDMWKQAAEGQNYEELTKESILDSLITMHLLEAKQEEYAVSISDAEKAEIAEVAQTFLDNNGEEEKEMISASSETIERLLTLMLIEMKMQVAMTADVDTNVADSEAAQKRIEYVPFTFTLTDDEGATTVIEDDGKEAFKATAADFAKEAKTAEDFAQLAEENERVLREATFDSESTHIAAELLEAVDVLKEGETTDLIETEEGYYIARLVSLLDREATDAKKENIVATRKSEAFQELREEWEENANIERNEKAWKAISFTRQGVIMKVEELEEEVDSTIEPAISPEAESDGVDAEETTSEETGAVEESTEDTNATEEEADSTEEESNSEEETQE
jgi:hypothetical protein